eukprot:TRINITY_DN12812_c0_g1_i5.p1 TRINITY_DN12812_c0_g1~~TRINITY_DN12812_c0_g1_i5.p1  ORF type:complete len:637 (-),score=129.66 TRINITY_DN12812_c0_g1_i5:2046-3956(-)
MNALPLLLSVLVSCAAALGVLDLSYSFVSPSSSCSSASLTVSYATSNSSGDTVTFTNLTYPSGTVTVFSSNDTAVLTSWFNLTIDNTANTDPICSLDLSVNETSSASGNVIQSVAFFKQVQTMAFQLTIAVVNTTQTANLTTGSGWLHTPVLNAGFKNFRVISDAYPNSKCSGTSWMLQSLSVVLGSSAASTAPASVFSTIYNDYTYAFNWMVTKKGCNPPFAVIFYNSSGVRSVVFDSLTSNYNSTVALSIAIVGGNFNAVNSSVDTVAVTATTPNVVDLQVQAWFIAPVGTAGNFTCLTDQLQVNISQGTNSRVGTILRYGTSFFQVGFTLQENITLWLANNNSHPRCAAQIILASSFEEDVVLPNYKAKLASVLVQIFTMNLYPGQSGYYNVSYDANRTFITNPGWVPYNTSEFVPSLKLLLQSVDNPSSVTWRFYCGFNLQYTGNALGTSQGPFLSKDVPLNCMGQWHLFIDVNSSQATTAPQFSLTLHQNVLPQPPATVIMDSTESSKAYTTQYVVQFDLMSQAGSFNVLNVNATVDSALSAPAAPVQITATPAAPTTTPAPTTKVTTTLSRSTVNYIVGIVVGVVGTVVLVVIGMLVWLRVRRRKQGRWGGAPVAKTSRDFELPLVNGKP